jgi:RNA polymerase sigma factor (sigma-70 family)
MNFEYIEYLVTKCKNGDMLSKEKLAEEFRPLIFNLSKRSFIDGYEMQDIQNQCYETLFKCVFLYNLEKHRFVAYATNSIRNNLNDLIKRIKTRNSTEGNDALSLHDDVEKDLPSQDIGLEDLFCEECDFEELRFAINNLTEDEKEFIDFVFYKNNTVQTCAYLKNMCYSTACQRKNVILKKILKSINQQQ